MELRCLEEKALYWATVPAPGEECDPLFATTTLFLLSVLLFLEPVNAPVA